MAHDVENPQVVGAIREVIPEEMEPGPSFLLVVLRPQRRELSVRVFSIPLGPGVHLPGLILNSGCRRRNWTNSGGVPTLGVDSVTKTVMIADDEEMVVTLVLRVLEGDGRLRMIAARDGDRQRAFDAGADDYMSKPFSIAALQEQVEKLVRLAG